LHEAATRKRTGPFMSDAPSTEDQSQPYTPQVTQGLLSEALTLRLSASRLEFLRKQVVGLELQAKRMRDAIHGITCRLLPGESAMDMRFTRTDIERLEEVTR
jgi:hypothetical protein